ncbi:hypothetical protein [Bradyrhizobium sp. CSS354]|uniref:hypothetical protein n=1 Tax=Bradyrhizobium sp. CSS354 TaxID=2699172 RepID=UPI0023AFB846|nr:hypothetical protein [Bradyrhizobium sp. CSS354]MDE5462222.1 hypothetical protein [Bradyrhizobium sp. CSS354]
MPRFIIRFAKDVLGENGQMSEVWQTTIELDARDEREAELMAKARFCDIHGTHDWSLHADRLKVDPADFPS